MEELNFVCNQITIYNISLFFLVLEILNAIKLDEIKAFLFEFACFILKKIYMKAKKKNLKEKCEEKHNKRFFIQLLRS